MSKISSKGNPPVNILVTGYGSWPCPQDLIALHKKATKAGVAFRREPFGPGPAYTVPSARTREGKAYYARKREYVAAIDLVEASGVLSVVAA